jgi:hypothetical protein
MDDRYELIDGYPVQRRPGCEGLACRPAARLIDGSER